MKFHATLLQNGRTATGFEVPGEVVDALGSGKKPSVRVTIGAHTYRSTVATMDGRFMVPVSAENRQSAGLTAGDEFEVTLELDTAPRTIELPEDFAAALAEDPGAREFFESISYSDKRWHVYSIESAKKPETRQRRVARSVDMLRAGKAR